MGTWFRRLLHLFQASRVESELGEEIEAHRALHQARLEHDGMSPGEAARVSRLAVGNVTLAREDVRDVWVVRWVRELAADIRDGLRGAWRTPAFSLPVVLTWTLAIGATTAVFSVVNGVLLTPLAYREAHRLVTVREIVPPLQHLYPSLPANPRHFDLWRRRATTFASLTEMQAGPMALTGMGDPAEVTAVSTTAGLFETLAVQPALGRVLVEADEHVGGDDVVVLTDTFWRRELEADAAAVGRTLTLNGHPHTIVGVMPATFRFPDRLGPLTASFKSADVIVPLRLDLTDFSQLGEFNYAVLGRLRTGVSPERATADLNVIEGSIAFPVKIVLRTEVTPLLEVVVGRARRALWLLLAAIAGVLLIACANLANLSLTRAVSRERENAVRAALGAGRVRLVRRVVVEQLLLSVVGGTAGLLAAGAVLQVFVRTAPVDLPRVGDIALDVRVLVFSVLVSIAAGVAVALAPASRIGVGPRLQLSFRADGRTMTSDRAGLRARGLLLTAQVALSVMLLVVTALLTVSFARLTRVDPGFVQRGVLTLRVTLPATRYPDEASRLRAYDRLREQVATVPGVLDAAWTSKLPLEGESWVDALVPIGQSVDVTNAPALNFRAVSPDYFRALAIPIHQGRAFSESDHPAPTTPALISETAAVRFWPGHNPLGQRFLRHSPNEKPFEVVGVVPDGRMTQLDVVAPMMVYVPHWYRARAITSLVVRTELDPVALAAPLRQAIWSLDRDTLIADVRPMTAIADETLGGRRYSVLLFVIFGAIALLIAIVGIYAVTAYGIARRRREMNIRVALGAQASQVRRLVIAQNARPIAAGLIAGSLGAVALGGVVASFLIDTPSRDLSVTVAVAGSVGLAALLSILSAVARNLAIDPAAALRQE